jgi:flagellar basal-body rod protein FlgC
MSRTRLSPLLVCAWPGWSMEYAPNHPMANQEGYIFRSNVNIVEEMANMIAASRAYQSNVEVVNSAKTMAARTLEMGR